MVTGNILSNFEMLKLVFDVFSIIFPVVASGVYYKAEFKQDTLIVVSNRFFCWISCFS